MRIAPRSIARSVARNIWEPLEQGINDSIGGSAVLPPGFLAAYYATDYQPTPRKLIPNAASLVPVETSLLAYPRRLFNNALLYLKSGVTIVDAGTSFAPGDGRAVTNDASTFVTAGAGYIQLEPVGGITFPAGDYTLAIWVRSASGANQDFRMAFDFSGVTKTATTSWFRFTHTVTLTAASHTIQPVWTTAAATALNLEICDCKLYAGAVAGAEYDLAGHMYLGQNHFDTKPTASGGELNLSTGGYGVIQLAADTSFSAGTYMCVASKVAVATAYQAFLSKISSYQNLSVGFDENKSPMYYHNGSNLVFQGSGSNGIWDFNGLGYHFFCVAFSGTQLDFFVDDIKLYSRTISAGAITARDFWVGILNSPTLNCGHKFNSEVIYNSRLSNSLIAQGYAALVAKASQSSLTVTPVSRLYYAEGHSIPANQAGYVYQYGPASSPKVVGINNAIGGSTLASMTARLATLAACLPTNKAGRKFILTVDIGANDLYSYAGGTDAIAVANFMTDLGTFATAARAYGFTHIVGMPVLPRSDAALTAPQIATHNTRRALLRTSQLAAVGTVYDAFIDWGNNATMWPDAASNDLTLYPDKLHPSAVIGHGSLLTQVTPVLNAI